MPDISEFSDEPGKIWKLTGPNSLSSPGTKTQQRQRFQALFNTAEADLKDANERYQQAAVDSMDAAFRGLVFGCAAEGVTEIELEPSDQGDYMSINEFTAPDDVDVDTLMEDLWNFASDLTDLPDAPWRILPGVTVPTERGDYIVTIDVTVAAEGLLDLAVAPQCGRHGGDWGDDETCEDCTDEDGNPRPIPTD